MNTYTESHIDWVPIVIALALAWIATFFICAQAMLDFRRQACALGYAQWSYVPGQHRTKWHWLPNPTQSERRAIEAQFRAMQQELDNYEEYYHSNETPSNQNREVHPAEQTY